MTTKSSLLIWSLLASAALGGYWLYSAKLDAMHDLAQREAPPYVRVRDMEAVQMLLKDCHKSTSVQMKLYIAGATCESASSEPSPEVVEFAQESHKRHYYDLEMWPRIVEHTESLERKFAVFYMTLATVATITFVLWCRAMLSPLIIRGRIKVAEYARLPRVLKDASTSRKARQAQEDFETLKGLHENGLVSDEMFAERKEAIKRGLNEPKS